MIIDFTVQNFRSIKDEQLFSMHVETPKQHLAQHVAYPADDKIGVLRSAGIYGANASGKSNVLLALSALQAVACFSGNSREGDPIPWYLPYYLSDQTRNDPIRFEIEFFNTDKLRYVYAVSFDHERILQEVLDFFPTRQKANLFTRASTDTWETITFGGRYKGGVKRIPFFSNNSYLSKAGENAGASAIIRSVYKYLATKLIDLEIQNHLPYGDLYQKNNLLTDAARLLTHIDTGITGIEQRTDENQHEFQKLQVRPRPEIRNTARQKSAIEFWFSHITEEGTIEQFPQDWESAGTQQLFRFMPLLFNAFQSGSTLIIDEIERSLHPHVAELIIKLFNDPSINTNDAQLIFTTHNINLMAPDKMRRDQIWFTDKKKGKTTLYSLDDFDKNKVKSDSPFPAWYNDGRFDAVPHIDYLAITNLLRPEAKP